MRPLPRNRLVVWVAVFALIVGGSFTYGLTSRGESSLDNDRFENLRTVLEVVSLVRTQYVDPVDTSQLIAGYIQKGTINGMLQAALRDRYTRYLPRSDYRQMQIKTSGIFAGLGIHVLSKDDRITIIAPMPGTPAARAGLRPGDHIIRIDGRSTEYMSLDEAVSLMRGEQGTPVVLGIEREAVKSFDVRIVRDIVRVPSVTQVEVLDAKHFPGLREPAGYIRLVEFTERTDSELHEALAALTRQNVHGLILDLRYNPGGLLSAAISVTNLFLSEGPIVHVVGRDQQKRTVFAAGRSPRLDLPLVILVNQFSASAAEIVSGALQDRDVATLVGTRTFGKGLVQTVIPLRDRSAVSLTTARYQTPSGRSIDGTGIEPDVVVPEPKPADAEGGAAGEKAGPEAELDPAVIIGKVDLTDVQVRRAIQVLQEKMAARYEARTAA